jgi:hypothetical protein
VTDRVAEVDVDLSLVAVRRSTVSGVELDGETVLYDEATGHVHHLNHQAALVWMFLDGQTSLAELTADLADAFQVDPATMSHDVLTLARRFVDEGLLAGTGPEPDLVSSALDVPMFLGEPPSP